MSDYIKRDEAIAVLCDACGNAACPKGVIPRCLYYEKYEKMISIPAADVRENVHAHWETIDGCAYCSSCKNNFKKAIMSHANFCPQCGAKMDGGG